MNGGMAGYGFSRRQRFCAECFLRGVGGKPNPRAFMCWRDIVSEDHCSEIQSNSDLKLILSPDVHRPECSTKTVESMCEHKSKLS